MEDNGIISVLDGKPYCIIGETICARNEGEHHYSFMDDAEACRWILKNLPDTFDGKKDLAALHKYRKTLIELSDKRVDLNLVRREQQYFLCCKSGILKLEDGKVVRHINTDDLIFTNALNFNFIENAKIEDAEAFEKLVKTTLEDEPARIQLLLEIIGACTSNFLRFRKAFFLIGATGSGKTVISGFITRVIGEQLVSTVPMAELSGKHASSAIVGMHLNCDDELTTRKIKNAANFKSLVSMARMKTEPKGVTAVSFTNHAHLLFCGNALPDFEDFDGNNAALFSRMVVLDFPVTIPEADMDIDLPDKLWEERDIICSLAIMELARLVNMKKPTFTETESYKRMKASYVEGANALENFIAECCEYGEDKRCHFCDFLAAFKAYCKDNALTYRGSDSLIKQTILKNPMVVKAKFRMGSNNRYGAIGLGLK